MYTSIPDPSDEQGEMQMIMDPKGEWVATTLNQFQASRLLQHLNRD